MSTSGGSTAPSGAAGGDLSGTYPNPGVAKIKGTTLGTLSGASNNNVLTYQTSSTSWIPQAPAGAGSLIISAVKLDQGNPISFSSSNASSFTELATLTNGPGTGTLDMTVSAVAGDIIMLMPCFLVDGPPTGSTQIDVKVVNSGTFLGGGATGTGMPGWYVQVTTFLPIGGSVPYTVVSGDISGGQVKFRPMVKCTASGGSEIICNTSSGPYFFTALNLTALTTGT